MPFNNAAGPLDAARQPPADHAGGARRGAAERRRRDRARPLRAGRHWSCTRAIRCSRRSPREGLFVVQDEASQLVAVCGARPRPANACSTRAPRRAARPPRWPPTWATRTARGDRRRGRSASSCWRRRSRGGRRELRPGDRRRTRRRRCPFAAVFDRVLRRRAVLRPRHRCAGIRTSSGGAPPTSSPPLADAAAAHPRRGCRRGAARRPARLLDLLERAGGERRGRRGLPRTGIRSSAGAPPDCPASRPSWSARTARCARCRSATGSRRFSRRPGLPAVALTAASRPTATPLRLARWATSHLVMSEVGESRAICAKLFFSWLLRRACGAPASCSCWPARCS